ncbi:MAG: ATP-dependent helicase/nuclease subunit A [uncultured Sulfurimonas sp.]|nr:MAG: ATP-dependent helicase/nuclease subunit A [uncultured Sulfurimonas sp.]
MAFKQNLAYEASAGSGKTFMLVVRYLSLLFRGSDPTKILALTFTNKAAHEMQERVVETLEELEYRDELFEIAKVTDLSAEYLVSQRETILNEFLNAHTKIMTIDSFFTHILRKFSLYASLMPDFSTFASQHEQKLLERFLKEVSVAGKRSQLINLSLESKKRVTDIFTLLDAFYLKKEELSHIKFVQTSTDSFKKEAMLALSNLQGIVNNCKGASASLIKAVTAESFDDLLTKSWIVKETLEYWVFKKCFSLEMNQNLHIIQEAIKGYYKAKEQNFFYVLSDLVDIYQKAKKGLYMEDSELSFSDVTSLVHTILHKLDDSEFLYFRLDAKIEHMLLDEFQDTSITQYEILKPLIQEITSGSGIFENGSFFFVGDVKQSIYRFRGGVSALFGAVVEENATEVQKLLTNYRSQKEVIEFVNRSFVDKIKNYSDQLVRPSAQAGYVEVVLNNEPLVEATRQVKKLLSLGADSNNIAILCNTNGDGEAIKNALLCEKIDVVTETTTKLINQQSVKAILEYLKYLYFNEDIYRHNFFALIEQTPLKVYRADFNKTKLLDIVKKAIDKYKLFNDDFHLVRFLNAVARYPDVEALLFEYERLDTAAASSDISGVRVLTIHKSKGLEYENVIVMDSLKRPNVASDSIIYNYNGISLASVYLRTKNRDAIDIEYERALEKEKILVKEDKLNALYVAFTRARENLVIIKKPEKSSFDLLDLQVAQYGQMRISAKEKEPVQSLERIDYKELYYGTQSDILALENEIDGDLKAINFGIALHYMLEMMSEFTLDAINNAENMMLNKYGSRLEDSEIQDISKRVELFVRSNAVQELLQGKCYKEKALRYKKKLRYIDLLVQEENGSYIVIDYKSSMSYSEHHVKQVRAYVRAIKEISGENVKGIICYLLASEIKLVEV